MNEFDMESYVDRRLLEIADLKERVLYKEIVGDILKKVYEYNEQSYRELEQKILSETSPGQSDYAVYLTLTDLAHYDETDPFMYAMVPEDTREKVFSCEEIRQALKEHISLKLYTVFLQAGASAIYGLLHSDRLFHGVIKTRNREYKGTFCVRKNETYLDMVKELYDIFTVNCQPWTTVCEAYLAKMLDVCLCDAEEMGKDEEIQEIQVDFEEYGELVRCQIIPLWNLKKISEKTSTYPDAAIDKINYEHQIFSHRLSAECEYLVMDTDVEITQIRRVNGDLIITCPDDRPREWQLYQVNKGYTGKKYLYPVLSNRYKESFSGNLAEIYRRSIKTKAEMARLIESFPYKDYMRFLDFEIVREVPKECEASNYNMDGFIQDEIRAGNFQQVMLLRFAPVQPGHYLNEDIMCFLVTQVQKIFPEYQCVGKLV